MSEDSDGTLLPAIIEEEETEIVPAVSYRRNRPSKKKALEALRYLEGFLLDGNPVDDAVREKVNTILAENANRLRALTHGMARACAEENIILGQDFDRVMDIASTKIDERSSIQDLAVIGTLILNKLKANTALILETAKVPDPTKLDKPGEAILDRLRMVGMADIPTTSERKKAQSVLDKVIREAQKRYNKDGINNRT